MPLCKSRHKKTAALNTASLGEQQQDKETAPQQSWSAASFTTTVLLSLSRRCGRLLILGRGRSAGLRRRGLRLRRRAGLRDIRSRGRIVRHRRIVAGHIRRRRRGRGRQRRGLRLLGYLRRLAGLRSRSRRAGLSGSHPGAGALRDSTLGRRSAADRMRRRRLDRGRLGGGRRRRHGLRLGVRRGRGWLSGAIAVCSGGGATGAVCGRLLAATTGLVEGPE